MPNKWSVLNCSFLGLPYIIEKYSEFQVSHLIYVAQFLSQRLA